MIKISSRHCPFNCNPTFVVTKFEAESPVLISHLTPTSAFVSLNWPYVPLSNGILRYNTCMELSWKNPSLSHCTNNYNLQDVCRRSRVGSMELSTWATSSLLCPYPFIWQSPAAEAWFEAGSPTVQSQLQPLSPTPFGCSPELSSWS